jgi:hypothetical protein
MIISAWEALFIIICIFAYGRLDMHFATAATFYDRKFMETFKEVSTLDLSASDSRTLTFMGETFASQNLQWQILACLAFATLHNFKSLIAGKKRHLGPMNPVYLKTIWYWTMSHVHRSTPAVLLFHPLLAANHLLCALQVRNIEKALDENARGFELYETSRKMMRGRC